MNRWTTVICKLTCSPSQDHRFSCSSLKHAHFWTWVRVTWSNLMNRCHPCLHSSHHPGPQILTRSRCHLDQLTTDYHIPPDVSTALLMIEWWLPWRALTDRILFLSSLPVLSSLNIKLTAGLMKEWMIITLNSRLMHFDCISMKNETERLIRLNGISTKRHKASSMNHYLTHLLRPDGHWRSWLNQCHPDGVYHLKTYS